MRTRSRWVASVRCSKTMHVWVVGGTVGFRVCYFTNNLTQIHAPLWNESASLLLRCGCAGAVRAAGREVFC